MRRVIATAALVGSVFLAARPTHAQSLGFSDVNWCKWKNPPAAILREAIAAMDAQLVDIEVAMLMLEALSNPFPEEKLEGVEAFRAMMALVEYTRLARRYEHRRQVLDCLHNKLEELEIAARTKSPPSPQQGTLARLRDKAAALKRRRDAIGPLHDNVTIIGPTGAGKTVVIRALTPSIDYSARRGGRLVRRGATLVEDRFGVLSLSIGLGYRLRFNPALRIGDGNAARDFDTNTRTLLPRLELKLPLPISRRAPIWFSIGAEGGTGSHTRRGGDLSGIGRIFSIDGTNTQTIAAARDARLSLDHDTVMIDALVSSRIRSRGRGKFGYILFGGFHYARDRWRYEFVQQVSAGGPFFDHAVQSRVAADFFGFALGGTYSHEIAPGWVWTVTGRMIPGYQRTRLRATQFPGTFGAATVEAKDSHGGFALRAGISTTVEMRAASTIFIAGTIGYEHRGRTPFVRGLDDSGGARLGHRAAHGLFVMIRARIPLH
ncbi:MAG: hypothetical protein KIT16_01470 [Rhodospirillaceae bacterium]|nr:hypothetical protein [Rhodospirillaceae bacterium]